VRNPMDRFALFLLVNFAGFSVTCCSRSSSCANAKNKETLETKSSGRGSQTSSATAVQAQQPGNLLHPTRILTCVSVRFGTGVDEGPACSKFQIQRHCFPFMTLQIKRLLPGDFLCALNIIISPSCCGIYG